MKHLSQIRPELVVPELTATSKQELLAELARVVASVYPQLVADQVAQVLAEREQLGSTGIGEGVAIPHGKLAGLPGLVLAFGRSRRGIGFEALDNKPSHLFFLLLAPEEMAGPYLAALAALSRFLKNPQVRSRLLQAPGRKELLAVLAEADEA